MDLELTHFYLTHTYKTLWGRPEAHLVWRDVIFLDAVKHPPLLNGLLAVAAMHKIVTCGDPDSVYKSTALRKQTAALEGFVPLLHSVTQETAELVFVMSILVSYWAFASLRLPPELSILSTTVDLRLSFEPDHSLTAEPILTQFLELVKRVQPNHHVVNEARPLLLCGKLSAMTKVPGDDELPDLDKDTKNALSALNQHIHTLPRHLSEYHASLPLLKLDYMYRMALKPEWGELIIAWPVRVPNEFVEDMRARNHAALTILAYWGVALHTLQDRWWAKDWGVALITEISSIVTGPWAELLRWPRRRVGLDGG